MPVPQVKKGKWSKERERTKSGRWRKKRSDADQPRNRKHSRVKYIVVLLALIVCALVVLYIFFPELWASINPFAQ